MNSHLRAPLDVCLLNGRAYVQATQILARVGERLDPEGTLLTQAKFARLTQHMVCALPDGQANTDHDAIGSATFMRGHERIDYQFVELPPTAPKQDHRLHMTIAELQHDHALSGQFSFTCEATFAGVLDAMVQGIKTMHEALGPGTSDIWFTGLRNFALPLHLPGFEGRGVARITRLRLLASPPRQQSLMKVSLSLNGLARPVEGLVSFAFDPGTAVSIEAVAFALPGLHQTVEDVALQTGAPAEFIAGKVGMKERAILAEGETGVSLAVAACRKLVEKHASLLADAGLLVCVTQNPDRRIPHNAPSIAHQLGLSEHVASFDISLGCSGYVYGVEIVEGFLARCGIEHAILVTCDPYSRIMASEDRNANCVFGDAATATWIRASGTRSRVLATHFGTDGAGAAAISIPSGGASRPFVSLTGTAPVTTYERDELRLHMDGRAVYNFVLDRVPASIEACLRQVSCSLAQVDHFVLHQGSAFMLDAVARKLGLPPERLSRNMSKFGNTVSSSIPLLLAELDEASQLEHRLVLMSGFGVGLSWATALVQFN